MNKNNTPAPARRQIIIEDSSLDKTGAVSIYEQPTEIVAASALTSQQGAGANLETTEMLNSVTQYFSVGSSINIGKRKSQQDSVALSNNDYDDPCINNTVYGVLSDGMGGLNGGEIASAICTARMMEMLENADINNFSQYIKSCYNSIDSEIAALEDENGDPLGAGATMITFFAQDNRLCWASVGDSHIYLINKNGISRLNREHNYMLHLMAKVENGEITPEEANSDKQKDALISFMGMGGLSLIDVSESPLVIEKGDIVLACSDGMYRALTDTEIEQTVRLGANDVPLLANILINKTLEKQRKYQDNVSVIIAKKL